MNSIGCALALLAGTTAGLIILDAHPSGLDPTYGFYLLLLASFAAVPALIGRSVERVRWASLFLLFASAGCGRALITHPPVTSANLSFYNTSQDAERIQVTGTVINEPVLSDRSQRLRVRAEMITRSDGKLPRQISGDMYATLTRYPVFSVGERLLLSGTLTDPPQFSGFDYRAYLARQGVYSYMTFPLVKSLGSTSEPSLFDLPIRRQVRHVLEQALPEPQASLTIGVVTGDRSSMSKDLQDAFQRSGTTHILAISGQNISLLIGFTWLLFNRGGDRRRMPLWLFIIVMLSLLAYTRFTGATPSVVRAAVMGALLLSGPVVGRRYDPTSAILASAAFMTLLDPDVLLDGGFQLSFLATVGIIYLGPACYSFLSRLRFPAALALPIATSLGAQVATLPLAALLTGQASLVSLPATLVADFALLPLMITGIATGILGSIWLPLGQLVGLTVWPFASWLVYSAQAWGAIPWASLDVPGLKATHVLIYYIELGTLIWFTARLKRQLMLLSGSIILLAVLALLITGGVIALLFR